MLTLRPLGTHLAFTFLKVCALAAAGFAFSVAAAADDGEIPQPARYEAGEPVWRGHPGPWGDLEIRSLYLEAPDYMVAGLKQPNSTTAWNFADASEASLTVLFERAGLSKETMGQLLNPQRILIHEGVWTLFADPALVMALTIEQRSTIYQELAASALNPMHAAPAYVFADNAEDWLRGAKLPEEQKQTVRQLLWKDHGMLAFSDVSILLALAKSDAEVARVFKFMTRVRTLVVDLNLPPDVDVNALAHYWTGEGKVIDSMPLLESAAESDSKHSIDITHLLPATARAELFTFPKIEDAAEGRLPDCQWTALNFFNATPHDYYLDARLTSARLREAYEIVDTPYRYGDVLEFLNPDGDAVHACVYIGDNIVFTKNGDGMIKPWVLMWLSDVKRLYVHDSGCRVTCYRLKPTAS